MKQRGRIMNRRTSEGFMSAANKYNIWRIILFSILMISIFVSQPASALISGCTVDTSKISGSPFNEEDFSLVNVGVDGDGYLYLKTGDEAINPEGIVIPFDQEVWVSFFYEDSGYLSTLGWIRYNDNLIGSDGKFIGWNNVNASEKHPIFRKVADGADGGDGILDIVQGLTEDALSKYDDGTNSKFVVNGDGQVSLKDMKKPLGNFKAGDEIVFFFGANQDYTSTSSNNFFFTKKNWNPDQYPTTKCIPTIATYSYWIDKTVGTFYRTYDLGRATESYTTGDASCADMDKGLLDADAIDRLFNEFGLTLSGSTRLEITTNQKFPHVINAAPTEDENQWILSWEDMAGGGDMDYNDMTFRIELKTGGSTQTKEPIFPNEQESYYTAVTFDVYDYMPGGSCQGQTDITYELSIDNGSDNSWVEIKNWDTIKEFSIDNDGNKTLGNDVTNWAPGSPEYTYRSARVDFAGLGLSGRELLWRATMVSENKACVPKILSTSTNGSVATHGFYSRSSPVMTGNMLYSGSYETPDTSWTELRPRGHVKATRLYEPTDPSTTRELEIWDAGTVLDESTQPNTRTIYFPNITVTQITNEILGVGDGSTKTFTGTLAQAPVLPTSLTISCDNKNFKDEYINELNSLWGNGAINRLNGEFSITFKYAPAAGIPIIATYTTYQTTTGMLNKFVTDNLSNLSLGLDNTYVSSDGYTYDFDGNGDYDANDGKWLTEWLRGYADGTTKIKEREWKLGSIDHSTPALLTPPATPNWYYGSDTTDKERESYDIFVEKYKNRDAILFVGSLDGMLHAFDAGAFRWGNNPLTPTITENRGYFEWQDLDNDGNKEPNYGNGSELWAFIPANLLSKLKNNYLRGADQAYVDASPTLSDVYIDGAWHTVLLAAEGSGGDSVFCLDVTDPSKEPTLLWEFSDPDLFRSRSSPAVGKIGRIMDNGTVRWAAFFVSGKNYDSNQYPSIYIIDIADGSLIQRIYLDDEVTEEENAPSGLGGVPSGQPAIIDSDSNGYIDRLYVGTDKGLIYKVNLSDDPKHWLHEINNCIINTDFETDDGSSIEAGQRWHPVYASPASGLCIPDRSDR